MLSVTEMIRCSEERKEICKQLQTCVCSKCGSRQVQLTHWINNVTIKCRSCKHSEVKYDPSN